MENTETKVNLLSMSPEAMRAFFVSIDEKPFRATQLIKWIYQQGVIDIDQMTNLSKALREKLHQVAEIRLPEIIFDKTAKDGTRKWVLKLDEKNAVEMVFIPEKSRGTLCISSQVGCALDCSFCSTAKQGFNRNLTVDEIISQLWIATDALNGFEHDNRIITNVVLMGMGEPLANYDNVVQAIQLMLEDNAFCLSKRRVTLSTSGIVPALDRLGQDVDVSLAVSLHATNDKLRDELVPINKKYPLKQLLEACKRYIARQPNRKITFEYVMIDGVNDRQADARALIKLLAHIPSKINLIPFNPFPGAPYKTSPQKRIDQFQKILSDAGYTTIMRRTRGDDIDAACGQLVGQVMNKRKRSQVVQMDQQINTGEAANAEAGAGQVKGVI